MIVSLAPLLQLYVTQLQDPYEYETAGRLGISIDRREDFKAIRIHPTMEGYEQYQTCYANSITEEDEVSIIAPFEERAELLLDALEEIALSVIADVVTSASVELESDECHHHPTCITQ